VKTQDVHLPSSSAAGASPVIELAGTLYLPDDSAPTEPAPGLVVGHGAGSRRTRHDQFCREACSAGFVVLGLDFRGHGDSAGFADGPLELDLCAAAAFLRAQPSVDPEKICYRGSSMGGFYGLKAAPQAGFAAIALLCPATESVILHALDEQEAMRDTEAPDSPGAAVSSTGQRFPSSSDEPPRWDVPKLREYFEQQQCLSLAALVECPVLFVHARADEVVPFTHTLLLTQSLVVDTTLLALANGNHTTAQHDPAIHRYTVDWLRDQLISCSGRT
jgi:dipeptidyl aminopeptidase/acylaminoacyl peptidase